MESLRAALAEATTPAGGRIGFADRGRPSELALDLAIQAAGGCSAPLPGGLEGDRLAAAAADRRCEALAAFGLAVDGPSALPLVALAREPPAGLVEPGAIDWTGGSVLVETESGAGEWSQPDLLAAAQRFAARLASAAEPPSGRGLRRETPRREILVLPRGLADPAGRTLAAWSLAAGAALALEPDRERRAATAAWVRPTVFAGDPDEIATLREAAGQRRRGPPFRRLHTVAVLGGAPLAEAETAWWRDRGVALTVV